MGLIEVTEPAAEQIRDLLQKDGKADTHGLRMKVVGGGCSGLRYELAFDDQVSDRDTEVEAGGVPAEVLCAVLERMRTSIRNRDGRGATGGLILLDSEGSGAFAFSTPHMARAGWSEGGEGWAAV